MNIYTTRSRHGILNNSSKTPGETAGYSRAVAYKGQLFCTWIAGPNVVDSPMIMSRSATSDWDTPAKLVEDFHTGSTPTLFTFGGRLHALVAGVLGHALLLSYDDRARGFPDSRVLDFSVDGTPATAVLNNQLYVFYSTKGSRNVFYRTTSDLQVWSRAQPVKSDGVNAVLTGTGVSTIAYQGLGQLLYQAEDKTCNLLQFDSRDNWTRARPLILEHYAFTPTLVVHNGLLKLICSEPGEGGYVLSLYSFDGHSISGRTQSTDLSATRSVAAAVLNDELVVLYRGAP